MNLSAKQMAYENYLDQAKKTYNLGNIPEARILFLKAAELANEIATQSNSQSTRNNYFMIARKILDFVTENCTVKIKVKSEKSAPEEEIEIIEMPPISLEEALRELDVLIGLDKVKNTISNWVKQIQIFKIRQDQGLRVPPISYHMVFTGNPGTGKTTVARIVSKIYRALGILSKGHLVEVDRSKLVAGYIGQTATLTNKVIEKASGGILFIDEAYTLSQGGDRDFGSEAIATLLKAMEDKREDFAVIVAGYDDLMADFINSNPGLSSRFKTYILFDDYQPGELMNIFRKLCIDNDYEMSQEFEIVLQEYFSNIFRNRTENFGNGRTVRNLFEKVIVNQSVRLAKQIASSSHSLAKNEMKLLVLEDLESAD